MVAGGTKVRIPAGARLFICCSKSTKPTVSPTGVLFTGYCGYLPGANRPGLDPDHSAASSTNVKNICG